MIFIPVWTFVHSSLGEFIPPLLQLLSSCGFRFAVQVQVDRMKTTNVAVIDVGTGYIKMGYAGNEEPTYIIPTAYADTGAAARQTSADVLADLDFHIGSEATSRVRTHTISYPIQHGIVEDWDRMERIWQHCIYKYLRVEPEEYGFILTEPPANPPENREYAAEVLFETFGVQSMYIGVQGVLALTASWNSRKAAKLGLQGCATGTVIDSGDGVTHIIPVVDGYVVTQAIKHIPLAGRNVTNFVLEKLRERERIPADEALAIAQRVKEQHCYICKDLAAEFHKYDSDPAANVTHVEDVDKKTGQKYSYDVAYEKFIGPEIFFHPEIFTSEWSTPLPEVVDDVIMSCPMDARKPLYKNIVLSGGTTLFQNFDRRLQKDMRTLVDARIERIRSNLIDKTRKIEIDVNVVSHERQRYAVWYGGSYLGSSPQYAEVCHTKKEYEEYGPSICRRNAMFRSAF